MTLGAGVFHGTCALSGRPFDGKMMYTELQILIVNTHSPFNYINFNIFLNCSLILTHARRSDQYCRA